MIYFLEGKIIEIIYYGFNNVSDFCIFYLKIFLEKIVEEKEMDC